MRFFAAAGVALLSSFLQANVFLPDSRQALSIEDPAHKKIVKILSDKGSCTGSWVDAQWVLTNLHCVGAQISQMRIFSEFQSGRFRHEHSVLQVVSHSRLDMALLRVQNKSSESEDLNEDFNVPEPSLFKVHSFEDIEAPTNLNLLGYSMDFQLGGRAHIQQGCGILEAPMGFKTAWGQARHNCDTGPGASGSPLFSCDVDGVCVLWGIHAGGPKRGSHVFKSLSYRKSNYVMTDMAWVIEQLDTFRRRK